MELADKNISELQAAALTTAINAVQNSTGEKSKKRSGQACYRCGGPHSPATCRFKSEKCRKCEKYGHIAKCAIQSTPSKGRLVNKHMGSMAFRHVQGQNQYPLVTGLQWK